MDCAAASALLLVLRGGYVDAEGARAVEGALFDNNKKRETSVIVGPRGDDPILDPAPVARLLRLPLSTAASLVAGVTSVFAGVRLGVLADGLPPARAPALAGLLLPPGRSSSIGRGDAAVLTVGHVVFVVNVRTLVAAAIATRRHGRALRARTVVPPTGAGHHSHALLLPTPVPVPVPVACGSHLRRPCLLPRQAQAEWYTRLGDAASVLVRRVLASRHRPSAASGPAAAVAAAAAAAAAAVATVEVEELGGTCPVAVCALLLGFPVAYDTQWPYGVSRGEGGVGAGGGEGGGLSPGPIGSNCLGCVDLVLHSATIRGGDDVVAFSVPASLSSDASVRTALWWWGKGMRMMCEDRGEGGGTVALTATAENRPSVAL
jgi:hypothetical protein